MQVIMNLAVDKVAVANKPLTQWDYGQKLQLDGVDLPTSYEVHFSTYKTKDALVIKATSNIVNIPDAILASVCADKINVYVYVKTETDGTTVYKGIINCNMRSKPDDYPQELWESIDEWYHIIKKLDEFNPNSKLDLRRIYRNNIPSGTSASMSPDVNKPSWAQGICVTGTEIIYSLSNLTNVSNNTKLIKLNKSNLELISETILELGHANSISYDKENNEIYCAECYNTSGGSKRIFVIDNETMTIKRTITVDTTGTNLSGITWVYYNNDDKNIYVGSGSNTSYKLNSDYTLTAVVTISTSYNVNSTLQTRKIKNKRVYSLYYNPSTITIADIMTGKVSEVRNISEAFDRYQVGEVEDFDFDEDGNIYMLSHINYEGQALYAHQIFIGNIDTGYVSKIPATSNSQDPDVIYVDQSVASINPDGTQNNPFYELCEAVNYVKYMEKKPKQIHIANGEHEFTFINNLCTTLNFKNSASIRGLIIQNSIITLNDIIMKRGNYKSALNIYANSHIVVNNITFNGISNPTGGLIYNRCNDLTINGDVTKVDCICSYDINNSSYWKVKLANSNATVYDEAGVRCYSADDIEAVSVNEQSLTDTQKETARNNIGAGTSNFSGSYNDLEDLPELDYLPLTGGTVTSTASGALEIKRTSNYGSFIKFSNNSGILGYLGISGDGKAYRLASNGSTSIRLLDATDLESIEARLRALESK